MDQESKSCVQSENVKWIQAPGMWALHFELFQKSGEAESPVILFLKQGSEVSASGHSLFYI